jgi:hypothetical protein
VSQPCRQQRPIRPLSRLAAPHPPPRPGQGAYPLLVQSDARGRDRDLEVEVSHAANRENASPATLLESPASRPSISGPPDRVTPRSGDPEAAE